MSIRTFDESKVNRDHGRFAPKGYADAGQLDLDRPDFEAIKAEARQAIADDPTFAGHFEKAQPERQAQVSRDVFELVEVNDRSFVEKSAWLIVASQGSGQEHDLAANRAAQVESERRAVKAGHDRSCRAGSLYEQAQRLVSGSGDLPSCTCPKAS